MAMTLLELAGKASPEAVDLARAVLEQDIADRAWGTQVGAVLSQRDAARLLGRTEQAVSKDRRLLRLVNRDGRPVYPVVQFDGRRQLPGIADVVRVLSPVVEPLTVAAWLTAHNDAVQRRPVDGLRDGDTAAIMELARRFAHRAGR
ncbi:MAG: hypothetical protein M3467_11065 [Actinomycetota bacterium]|jgi:hypothetical protein|nr:hypothetical protein [Actinomycetota bacterium]